MPPTEQEKGPVPDARTARLQRHLQQVLSGDELENCMRCGFCQPACPTFQETGYEAASPRGRIALMKAVKDGLLVPDEAFRHQLDLCLGCRACEPACPRASGTAICSNRSAKPSPPMRRCRGVYALRVRCFSPTCFPIRGG